MRRGPARLLSLPILLVVPLPMLAQPTPVRAATGTGTPPTPMAPATAPASRPAAAATTAATSTRAAQPVGAEVVALRTATSRTYVDKHGLRAVVSPRPINYRDGTGAFQPIDTRLVAAAGGYTTTANAFAVTLPADLGAGAVAVGTPAGPVSFALVGAKGAASVSGASATYAGALPGVTLAYAATTSGVEETLTLASAAASASYTFTLTLPAGVTGRAAADGGLALLDGTGHAVATIPAPIMHDAKGAVGTVTLTLAAGRLTLAADPAWLASPTRVYPVTIDPSVVVLPGAAQDCYLDFGSPTSSFCSTDDEVGVDNSTQRQLLQFNLSSIPGPVDVLSAKLTLQETASQASSPVNVELHRVTDSWTTATTWTTRDGSTAWTSSGGDFGASPTWTTAVGPATGSYIWWLTSLVNAWANGTTPNNGLLLKAASETPGSFLSFASSRDPNQANWPTLTVTYEPQVGERGFSPLLGFGLTDRMGLAVNVANGNLLLHAHDVGIAGTGLPLVVDRLFNDLAGDVGDTNELGPGWIHSTGSDVWLDLGVAGDGIVYHGVGGYALFYQRNPDGSYLTPPGEDATLVKNGDGTFTLTWHGSGERYQFAANGNALRFAYNADTGTHTITDSQGRVLTFSYTNAGYPKFVTQLSDWTGRTWQYAYDASGNLVTYTDPAGKLTRYAYTTGDLTQITDPLGNVTKLTYQQTNPERVTSITFGAGSSVAGTYSFTYNTGNTVVTDPNNHSTTYYYDGQGRQTKVVDALSNTFQWNWTSDNHVAQYTDAKNQAFTNVYDDTASPPTCSTQVGTHNLCSSSLPTGATATWRYNDTAHPYCPTAVTDAQGNQVTTHYTAAGNPDTITNQLPSQNQTQVVYNGNGTVDHTVDARGTTTRYGYDGAGNLTTATPPAPLGATVITPDTLSRTHTVKDGKGQQTTATYDNLDRVTNTLYADSSTIVGTPDADGNLTSMADSTGTTSYLYDARNRKTQKTLPGTRTISYGYDLVSNLTSFTDAGGTVGYHYNPVNLVDTLTEPGGLGVTSFGYDPNHHRTSTTFPGGVVQTQTYDPSGRLTTIGATAPGGAALTSYAYTYQKNGTGPDTALPSVVTDTVNGRTVANTYDVLNRLTEWKVTPTGGSGATAHDYLYGYDGVGNRTQISADGIVSTLGYNAANEWTTDVAGGKTATFTWDAAGEELGNDGFGDPSKALAITYNAQHQTTSVTDTQQHVIPMTYTGAGQAERVTAGWVASNPDTPGGPATDTYGSGLVNQTDNTGATYYTRDPYGTLISQRLPNGTVSHYLFDGEGSVVALVDAAGNLLGKYFYCPTGNDAEPPTGANSGQPWRKWGAFYDPGTKMYHLNGLLFDANSLNATQISARLPLDPDDPTVLLRYLPVLIRRLAGFGGPESGTPIIIDTNAARGFRGGVLEDRLRALGYNARSVGRIFHGDPGDPEILALARIIGGRVLTYD